jgi:hypothetical protein
MQLKDFVSVEDVRVEGSSGRGTYKKFKLDLSELVCDLLAEFSEAETEDFLQSVGMDAKINRVVLRRLTRENADSWFGDDWERRAGIPGKLEDELLSEVKCGVFLQMLDEVKQYVKIFGNTRRFIGRSTMTRAW